MLCALSTNLDDNSTHFCVLLSSVACFAIGVVVNIAVTAAQTHTKKPCTDFVPHKAFVALFVVKQS